MEARISRGDFGLIEGIFDEEGPIHPKVTALPILHPRQHALNKIEKLGQMK